MTCLQDQDHVAKPEMSALLYNNCDNNYDCTGLSILNLSGDTRLGEGGVNGVKQREIVLGNGCNIQEDPETLSIL
jgi:hypothetical protein